MAEEDKGLSHALNKVQIKLLGWDVTKLNFSFDNAKNWRIKKYLILSPSPCSIADTPGKQLTESQRNGFPAENDAAT